jgi:hypothetical protein
LEKQSCAEAVRRGSVRVRKAKNMKQAQNNLKLTKERTDIDKTSQNMISHLRNLFRIKKISAVSAYLYPRYIYQK